MRQPVLFVPGAGDPRHPESSSRLADYLARELADGYQVIAPPMPDAEDPAYRPWRDAIEGQVATIDGDPILVGHSFGGSTLLKYLAERTYIKRIPGLFLASVPFWGRDFADFALPEDFAARLPPVPIFLYHSCDDPHVPYAHVEKYAERLPNATVRPIPGANHSFTDGLPELVADIRSLEEAP